MKCLTTNAWWLCLLAPGLVQREVSRFSRSLVQFLAGPF